MSNQTHTLQLAPRLDLHTTWSGCFSEPWPLPTDGVYVVEADAVEHVEPAPLAMLEAWCDSVRSAGGTVRVGDTLQTPYAYRCGLLAAITGSVRPVNPILHHAPPLRVTSDRDKPLAFTTLADAIDIESAGQLAAYSKALSEALNNVFEHAEAPLGAVVSASRFDRADRLTLAVVDRGQTVAGHMRPRHGATLSDLEAVTRAIEPCISGTAAPGTKGRARATPTNAGLGLYVMRQIAERTSGRFALVSGTAAVVINDGQVDAFEAPAPWAGTVVCVSYSIKDSDQAVEAVEAAITTGMANRRKHEPFSFDPAPVACPRVALLPTFRGFVEDKGRANQLREEVLLPAIDRGERVEIDLTEGRFIAHSCAHALLYEVIRRAGPEAKKRVHVRAESKQIKDVVRSIGFMAMEDRK